MEFGCTFISCHSNSNSNSRDRAFRPHRHGYWCFITRSAASCNPVSASKRATLHLPQKQIPCSQTRLDAIDPVGLTRCIFVDMEMMPATNDKDPAHSTAVGARLCAELQGMLASCTDRAVEPPAKLAEMLGDFLNAEASAAFKALQPQVDKHAEALLVEHGVSETAMRTRSLSLKQVSS